MARIMHVITGLYTGGAEMMLWKLLSRSHERYSHTVVSLGDRGTMGARIDELNVPVYALGLREAPSVAGVLSIRSLARRFQPQLILGWMYHGNVMASFAGLVSRGQPPVLWGVRHALDGSEFQRRLIVKFSAFLSRQPAAIIYNTAVGAQQHAEFGFRAAHQIVIPNGFDCQCFRPDPDARHDVRQELGLKEDAVLIGLVARYHPMKDHAGFLQASSMLAKDFPSARFILIGRGTQEPSLLDLVARWNLQDRVFCLGERPDMPRLTAALDVACSASAWGEGFSNAIGEAMACAVPCVVTEVGDSPCLVGQTGLSVPHSQPEALASAISRLISAGPEYRQQLGAAARRRVEENFSLPAVVCRFEEVFETYLQPQNGKRSWSASAT